MIYTIGHTANYSKAIATNGRIFKLGRRDDLDGQPYLGGYAVQTYEDALRLLREVGHEEDWTVWGLDANWETDTTPDAVGWWHDLVNDAWIIPLDEQRTRPDDRRTPAQQ